MEDAWIFNTRYLSFLLSYVLATEDPAVGSRPTSNELARSHRDCLTVLSGRDTIFNARAVPAIIIQASFGEEVRQRRTDYASVTSPKAAPFYARLVTPECPVLH